jgi:putative GTP pyrophosphokinase
MNSIRQPMARCEQFEVLRCLQKYSMMSEMSKTQVDRLGDRLKKGNITEDDLRLLDQYRRSFSEAYEIIVGTIRTELGLEPTGRPAKSTTSISDKLRRESIRLTQIQDIAGCRLIVSDIATQEKVVQSLDSLFEHTTVVDRRQQPSHGYRAVHVIVRCRDKMIEIQIRTSLQHLWAELSEKFSDVVNPAIKYGGGDETIQEILTEASTMVAEEEATETTLANAQARLSSLENVPDDIRQKIIDLLQKSA